MKEGKDTLVGPPCYEPGVIFDYVEGTLDTTRTTEFKRHLRECKRCRLEVHRLSAATEEAQELLPEETEEPINSVDKEYREFADSILPTMRSLGIPELAAGIVRSDTRHPSRYSLQEDYDYHAGTFRVPPESSYYTVVIARSTGITVRVANESVSSIQDVAVPIRNEDVGLVQIFILWTETPLELGDKQALSWRHFKRLLSSKISAFSSQTLVVE